MYRSVRSGPNRVDRVGGEAGRHRHVYADEPVKTFLDGFFLVRLFRCASYVVYQSPSSGRWVKVRCPAFVVRTRVASSSGCRSEGGPGV